MASMVLEFSQKFLETAASSPREKVLGHFRSLLLAAPEKKSLALSRGFGCRWGCREEEAPRLADEELQSEAVGLFEGPFGSLCCK